MKQCIYSYVCGCGAVKANVFGTTMKKKILVIGATGAMGQYLVPALAEMDYEIDAISLDEKDQAMLPD